MEPYPQRALTLLNAPVWGGHVRAIGEARHMPARPVRRLVVVGVELPRVELLSAAGAEVVILADAVDAHHESHIESVEAPQSKQASGSVVSSRLMSCGDSTRSSGPGWVTRCLRR